MESRKDYVKYILNDLTSQEIDTYLSERKVEDEKKEFIDKMTRVKEREGLNHMQKLTNKIFENSSKEFNKSVQNYYVLGEAFILAYLKYYIENESFSTTEVKRLINETIKGDDILKEYTYEIMKDF